MAYPPAPGVAAGRSAARAFRIGCFGLVAVSCLVASALLLVPAVLTYTTGRHVTVHVQECHDHIWYSHSNSGTERHVSTSCTGSWTDRGTARHGTVSGVDHGDVGADRPGRVRGSRAQVGFPTMAVLMPVFLPLIVALVGWGLFRRRPAGLRRYPRFPIPGGFPGRYRFRRPPYPPPYHGGRRYPGPQYRGGRYPGNGPHPGGPYQGRYPAEPRRERPWTEPPYPGGPPTP